MNHPDLRTVYFGRTLNHPVSVYAGQTVRIPRELLDSLQATPAGRSAVFDLTPRVTPIRLAQAPPEGCFTSLRAFPCPYCSDGSARWTICERCDGTRKIYMLPGEVLWKKGG
jgi:hypothetical protein